MKRAAYCIAAAIAVELFVPECAHAQVGPKADSLPRGAIADSAALLRTFSERIRVSRDDAEAWHRQGMLAWVLASAARNGTPRREQDAIRFRRMADSSLRLAVQLAPGNPNYRRMLGHYQLSNYALLRAASADQFERALEVARNGIDTVAHFDAALEAGTAHWRGYDVLANRRFETTPATAFTSFSQGAQMGPKAAAAQAYATGTEPVVTSLSSMRSVIALFEGGTQAVPPDVAGAIGFERAVLFFDEAYALMPSSPRAFRSVAMTMAEKDRWNELERFARKHVTKFPHDVAAWMSVGLGAYRSGKLGAAMAAFDSALKFMTWAERVRVNDMKRIRPTKDVSVVATGDAAQQAAMQNLYWRVADALWSRPGNETHAEFLARVAFADLRWTTEELRVRGADTDRGNIFVRYGPPRLVGQILPLLSQGRDNEDKVITTVWIYSSGLIFVFNGTGTYLTAQIAPDDRRLVPEITEANPVRWDNLKLPEIDTLPSQFARFRGSRDSVDLFMAVAPDVARIREAAVVASPERAHVWLMTPAAAVVYQDSTALSRVALPTWKTRVAKGTYILRAEASTAEATRAARTTSIVDASLSPTSGFTNGGVGLSDLLIASSAELPAGGGRRWDDLALVPAVDALPRNSPMTLVWENYEFGQAGGMARYGVVVTLVRERSNARQIVARVLGALGGTARIDRRDDRVTITFDRTVPHAMAFADQVNISLQGSPPGTYRVTLQVTDQIGKEVLSRTRSFAIRN